MKQVETDGDAIQPGAAKLQHIASVQQLNDQLLKIDSIHDLHD